MIAVFTLAAAILVGPKNSGAAFSELADVPWAKLSPGAEIQVLAGTYHALATVEAHGTAKNPIRIAAAPGQKPVLTNALFFVGAHHVVVSGLTITKTPYPGIAIRAGSDHIRVEDNVVDGAGLGIWIAEGAGGGNVLVGNVLSRSKTHGIALDAIAAGAADPNVIRDNQVFGNAFHGMEINANWTIVEHNVVHDNGLGLSGTSGIHVFAKDKTRQFGSHNTIRANFSYADHDRSGQDGNGIQIDQWCDDNLVAFNVVFGNDGAGLNIFDGSRNRLINNTSVGNMRDPGGRHAYKGEIVVASDFTSDNRARDNVVANNLAMATRQTVSALWVETTSKNLQAGLGPNLLFNEAGGPLLTFGPDRAFASKDIAAITRGRVAGASEAPAFVDRADPLGHGLALAKAPAAQAARLDAGSDMRGRTGLSATFGAYAAP